MNNDPLLQSTQNAQNMLEGRMSPQNTRNGLFSAPNSVLGSPSLAMPGSITDTLAKAARAKKLRENSGASSQ